MSSTTQSTSNLHLSSSWPARPGCNSSFSFLALRTRALPRWAWLRRVSQRQAWGARALGEGAMVALARVQAQASEARAQVLALAQVLASKEMIFPHCMSI